jgi:integrase
MKLRRPKWTHAYTDQHDKERFYLRRPGQKKVPLPGLPWSPEFMAAREAALNGEWGKREIGAKRTIEGTVNAALVSYYQTRAFTDLAAITQQDRRQVLEAFRADRGHRPLPIPTDALQVIVDKKTPASQRHFKKAMRGFVDHCITKGWIKVDPLGGLKLSKLKTKGHDTWTVEEVAQYRQQHAPGSKARLALELLLQTGHARADVVRMGRQHVKSGTLSMRRQKTGVQFDIPMLPELLAEIARHPKTDLPYLISSTGKPFAATSFGSWFRRQCNEAGLKHCSAHGLRKAAAVHHALNGATAPELMAWFGWKSISEAQRYIEEANRIRLAENAGARLTTQVGQNDKSI